MEFKERFKKMFRRQSEETDATDIFENGEWNKKLANKVIDFVHGEINKVVGAAFGSDLLEVHIGLQRELGIYIDELYLLHKDYCRKSCDACS